MRELFLSLAVLTLAACGQRTATNADEGCARVATHEVSWSNASAPDVVSARAEGPSCVQAVVTLSLRNADGDPLWAFASTYFDLTTGGAAPEDAPTIAAEEMDAFLAGWADVTLSSSGELPQWREGAATLSESATTFAYDTPFEREAYEMLRGRNLAMICYAAAVEATQCLVIDPLSNTPTMIVAYGP